MMFFKKNWFNNLFLYFSNLVERLVAKHKLRNLSLIFGSLNLLLFFILFYCINKYLFKLKYLVFILLVLFVIGYVIKVYIKSRPSNEINLSMGLIVLKFFNKIFYGLFFSKLSFFRKVFLSFKFWVLSSVDPFFYLLIRIDVAYWRIFLYWFLAVLGFFYVMIGMPGFLNPDILIEFKEYYLEYSYLDL